MGADLDGVRTVSSGVTAIVHVAHAGLMIGGAAGVLVLLSPVGMHRRRAAVAELRSAAATGNLVQLAEQKATGRADEDRRAGQRRTALVAAVIGSLIAAGVHVWVCPQHFDEGLRFGLFFLVATLCQTAWAVWVAWRPLRGLLLAGIAGNLAMIVLWILTRTAGLPFGLAEVEPVGGLDLVATIAEAGTVIACWAATGWGLRAPVLRPSAARPLVEQGA